jgi:hypothetical protein
MYGDGFDSKDITDGSMIDVDVSKTVKVSDKISASGNLEAIYNSNYFSGSKGFSHAGVSLSATYSPLENISITGSITGQQKIDPEMAYVNTEGYFKAGINIHLSKLYLKINSITDSETLKIYYQEINCSALHYRTFQTNHLSLCVPFFAFCSRHFRDSSVSFIQ